MTGFAMLEKAWTDYAAAVEEARRLLAATPRFQERPEHRAQAYYTLIEAQAMAYNFAVAPRLDHPRVYVHTSWLTYFYTLGQNGPDFYYGALFLDGRCTYRLNGRWGDLKVMVMQVHNHLLGHPESRTIGNHDFADFARAADGTFEAIISATPHEGNWIGLAAESRYNFILLRRLLADWHEDRGELEIELIDGKPEPDGQDPEAVARRIDMARQLLTYLVRDWNVGLYDFYIRNAGGKNMVARIPGRRITSELAGSPTSSYAMAIFDIRPDEAVIIELTPPESAYWSFQLGDVWSKSLDFSHCQTDINMRRAKVDADGKVRLVVALADPGVANWLDPNGRTEGTIVYRNYRAVTEEFPTLTIVKAAELDRHLPPETARVTPAERAAALDHRRRGYRKLLAQ